MAGKRVKPEDIVLKLRQVEVLPTPNFVFTQGQFSKRCSQNAALEGRYPTALARSDE
jgi:hypothetical protein